MTTPCAPNDKVLGWKLCLSFIVRCFVSIPLAVKQMGVIIPNITGTIAGTLKLKSE